MKLYYSPGACSMASHIVLKELGQPFETEAVDLATKKTASGKDFTTVNAKGYVPALEIKDNEVLTENQVVLQYLADMANATAMLPKAGTMARYRVMEILNFVAAELHKSLGALFNKALPEPARQLTIAKISKNLDYVNALLSGRKFIAGNDFTVADAYAFTVMNWGQFFGIDVKKWPNIAGYMERLAGRSSVKEAMKAEGLLA